MNYSWDAYLNGTTKLNINVTVYSGLSTLQLLNDTSPSLMLASGKYVTRLRVTKLLLDPSRSFV